ncbi:MAG: hypothetical protein R2939_20315 [Kofleriaceae bacterium]
MPTRTELALGLAVAVALAPRAAAATTLGPWVERVRAELEAASLAQRVPPRVPPVPVKARLEGAAAARRSSSRAPLATLTAASDLDGDGRAEVYLVSEASVVALRLDGAALVEQARLALPDERAPTRPRDDVAMARSWRRPAQRRRRLVRAGSRARGALRLARQRAGRAGPADRVARLRRARARAGRHNHFDTLAAPICEVACQPGSSIPTGHRWRSPPRKRPAAYCR